VILIVLRIAGIAALEIDKRKNGDVAFTEETQLPTEKCAVNGAIFVTLRILFRYRPWMHSTKWDWRAY